MYSCKASFQTGRDCGLYCPYALWDFTLWSCFLSWDLHCSQNTL